MSLFRLYVRSVRVIQEEFVVEAETEADATERFHDGEGDLEAEDIIECLYGPYIDAIVKEEGV